MSANLQYRPADGGKSLPDKLKYALEKRFEPGQLVFSASSIPYLHGLVDAGVEGANELIEAIEKHDEVIVWWQY